MGQGYQAMKAKLLALSQIRSRGVETGAVPEVVGSPASLQSASSPAKPIASVSVSFADDDVLAQVVELVFTAESCVKQGFYGVHFRQDGSCNTYLELEDRLRCMAVCRSWRHVLDPRSLPVESTMLLAAAGRLHPKVSWFCKIHPQVQMLGVDVSGALGNHGVTVAFEALTCVQPPTVLRGLEVSAVNGVVDHFLDMLHLFPNLRRVHLHNKRWEGIDDYTFATGVEASEPDDSASEPDDSASGADVEEAAEASAVSSPETGGPGRVQRWMTDGFWEGVPALEDLQIACFGAVSISVPAAPAALLTRLTRLGVWERGLEISCSMPRLQELDVRAVTGVVDLSSAQLRLPQLSHLTLCASAAKVDFSCMPKLAELVVWGVKELHVSGFSALRQLSYLRLERCSSGEPCVDSSLLQAAPASLASLDLNCDMFSWCQGSAVPSLSHLTQLTALRTGMHSAICELSPLSQLQYLELYKVFSDDIPPADIAELGKLTTLTRLCLSIDGYGHTSNMELLHASMPAGCVVDPPYPHCMYVASESEEEGVGEE